MKHCWRTEEIFKLSHELLANKHDANSPWNQIPWETDLSLPSSVPPP